MHVGLLCIPACPGHQVSESLNGDTACARKAWAEQDPAIPISGFRQRRGEGRYFVLRVSSNWKFCFTRMMLFETVQLCCWVMGGGNQTGLSGPVEGGQSHMVYVFLACPSLNPFWSLVYYKKVAAPLLLPLLCLQTRWSLEPFWRLYKRGAAWSCSPWLIRDGWVWCQENVLN